MLFRLETRIQNKIYLSQWILLFNIKKFTNSSNEILFEQSIKNPEKYQFFKCPLFLFTDNIILFPYLIELNMKILNMVKLKFT